MQIVDVTLLRAFVAAADCGSLSSAARRLGATLSTVSRQVQSLETELGVPLLSRTGRGVRLTPAGERFLERARYVLRELAEAAAEARGERRASPSQLRVSAPLELAMRLLPRALVEFRSTHPDVLVDVHADVRRVSLSEEDFDAAIRLGKLRDSDLVAKPLGSVSLGLYAARPRKELGPAVLVSGTRAQIDVTSRGRPRTLDFEGTIRVGTFTEAAEIATRSEMAAMLPSFTARDYLERGLLVRILPGLALPSTPVQLLHTQRLRGARELTTLASATSSALALAEASVRK